VTSRPEFRDKDCIRFTAEDVERAAAMVRGRCADAPSVALVLGSGLGSYADQFDDRTVVEYADIPGFPVSTVEGHAGRLVLGATAGVRVVTLQGRFHLYEGYSAAEVTFPLRVMHALGAKVLVVTNAAGGVDHRLEPGDLMLIEDHINFQLRSPLRGRGPLVDEDRFVDLCEPYSRRLRDLALAVAAELGIARLRSGTYFGGLGPSYETRAEVAMIRKLGGDAVGMSTVPEVLVARHLGMEVLGITCISNRAAGLSPEPLSHGEVIEVTTRIRKTFTAYLHALIPRLLPPDGA
jgi:purine-nucleoside phosphorylase